MPTSYHLSKEARRNLSLLQHFSDALNHQTLAAFLKSDEIKRFAQEVREMKLKRKVPFDHSAFKQPGSLDPKDVLHEIRDGQFGGGKLPGDQPGSGLPRTGFDLLDALHEMFHSMIDLGKTDGPGGGVDPAAGPNDDVITSVRNPSGSISTTVTHSDGSVDNYNTSSNHFFHDHVNADHSSFTEVVTYDRHGNGYMVTQSAHDSNGDLTYSSRQHYDGHGNPTSPGEDGKGGANSDNNPLHNLNVLSVATIEQMAKAYMHPAKDSEKLDPNSKTNPHGLTEDDKARLGGTVLKPDELDPNSGIDPLTQLNLDPNKFQAGKDGKELDPNTGLKHPLKHGTV